MAQTNSFAFSVKEEIVKNGFPDTCVRSLLSGFTKCNGSFRLTRGATFLDLSTESAKTAKYLYQLIKDIYGTDLRFSYTRGFGFRKNSQQYHVLVPEPDFILSDLEVDFLDPKVPQRAASNKERSAAYIAGCFLACGSVNDPSSSNYHLEMALSDPSHAKWLSHLLNKQSKGAFNSKVIKRRKQHVVYLKRSEEIVDFLKLIGAISSCFAFEDVRIERDFNNVTNRLGNLDSANFAKTMSAAARQKKEIEYFRDHGGYESIENPKLRILMELRLNNPDATLDELASLLSEELGATVSKSNVNHLFRSLHERYEAARR
ncbi:MAG: DNA-binding protein WhiA [Bacilli bacterium]|nr:DNA-binding protein WhiA [Bacilli bacterium]